MTRKANTKTKKTAPKKPHGGVDSGRGQDRITRP